MSRSQVCKSVSTQFRVVVSCEERAVFERTDIFSVTLFVLYIRHYRIEWNRIEVVENIATLQPDREDADEIIVKKKKTHKSKKNAEWYRQRVSYFVNAMYQNL